MNPLRSAILGGVAVLALAAGAAFAAETTTATTTTSADGTKVERRVIVVRSDGPGGPEIYDSADAGRGTHGPWGPGRHNPEHMAKHLRDVLQLTPSQEPALQAFLAGMAPPEHGGPEHGGPEHGGPEHRGPGGLEPMHDRGAPPADPAARKAEMEKRLAEMKARMAEMEKKHAEEAALSTPDRLDRMVKRMAERTAERQAELQRHVDVAKRFYAALTPSQQKAFDALAGELLHHLQPDGPGGPERQIRMIRMGAIPPAPPTAPLPPAPPPPPPGE